MIRHANDVVRGARLTAGTVIVGGGPAGITLALQLARTEQSVLLLESGGLEADAKAQALNAGEVADATLHSPPDTYRQRILGGGTSIWGGRCVPFDPIDFEQRPWIAHSGWPIAWSEIEPYYAAANLMCEAGACEYDARLAVPGGMRPVIRGFAPEHFDLNGIERFSCPTHFGTRYRARLAAAPNVSVLLGATVTRLHTSPDGTRITALDVRNQHDIPFQVEADTVVLATGGMEVPRLLLTSNDVHAQGIGNTRDLVGRFYMCHIAGTVGRLRIAGPRDAVWHGYDIAPDGTYCRRRIALRPEMQRQFGLGNVIYRLHHPRITDPSHRTGPLSAIYLAQRFISYEYAKRLVSDTPPTAGIWLRHGVNAATDALSTLRFLTHWLQHRTLADRKFPSVIIRPRTNLFSLDFHAEQEPNPDSRINLCEATDRFGNRQLRVDWRYTAKDVETVTRSFELLRRDLAENDVGDLNPVSNETDIETVIRRDGAYGGHHIGTARMASSAASGVVDPNGKVFGVNNLYIAGSATFPTSSQANPTLTIVALSLRLARHLTRIARHTPNVLTQEAVAAE
ncbi:MAG TPA: GMC family oxidoreductase [Rhodopila sp.]|uniref:GMC family oxidoreductase n=1 Tax=Rhodopila sp. TaxID=2480087 RepID=UPI002CE01C62|nr:GMC family oxidoreductase [Rhodopila sp.]HVY14993.1 GMC family oxidoreductase [Rhodopila sp.]